ncbi:MAG: hypothetical protein AB7T49_00710 [Oligoflexales bacterium]
MRSWIRLVNICLLSLVAAPSAFGFIDVQIFGGQRTEMVEANRANGLDKSTEKTVALHIAPIPIVPVAFGGYFSQQRYDLNGDNDLNIKAIEGWTSGAEVMTWIPFDSLIPYVKLSRYIDSSYEVTQGDQTNDAGTVLGGAKIDRGLELGGGLKWTPYSIVSLLLEARDGLSEENDSRAYLLGLEAAI